jgi:uncharacterized damage-inducible protein DinB
MVQNGFADHYRSFARYNGWANDRLYETASGLSDQDRRADRGVFFGSLNGTLNHLLVTDRIWRARCRGDVPPSDAAGAPLALDHILFEDFAALRDARLVEDRQIIAFAERLQEADMTRMLHYHRASTPVPIKQEMGLALAHWFNHQTHHRGQAHAVLSGLGLEPPALDLLIFQREAGDGR